MNLIKFWRGKKNKAAVGIEASAIFSLSLSLLSFLCWRNAEGRGPFDWMLVSVTQCWLVIMMAINKSVMKSPIRTLLLSFFGGWSLANDPLLPLCLRATCSSFFQRLIFSHSRRWMVRVNGGRRLLNRPFASVPDLLLIAGNYRPWFCFLRLLLFFSLSLSPSLSVFWFNRVCWAAQLFVFNQSSDTKFSTKVSMAEKKKKEKKQKRL